MNEGGDEEMPEKDTAARMLFQFGTLGEIAALERWSYVPQSVKRR
jgi:hypothetical protein